MTLKQWLLLQNLLAQSSENVDAQNTQTENTANQTGDTSTVNEGDKLFTQDEVNKIVAKRAKEVKNQYKDYDDLKQQVTTYADRLKALETAKKEVEKKYTEETFNFALESAAKELNLDPKLASKLLDKDKIIVQDDKPSNLKELLQALIEKHPNLVKKQVVTPVIETPKPNEQKYSLHRTPNTSNFFSGSGLRLNHVIKE